MRSHRNAVEQLRLDQLHTQQQKFLTIFEASFDRVTLLQGDHFKQVSNVFAALFQLTPDELENTRVGDLLPKHLFEQDIPVQNKILKRSDGQIRNFQVVRERTGENETIIAIRDITEIQERQTRKMMLDRITAAGTLAVGIAHELNTPLMIAMHHT